VLCALSVPANWTVALSSAWLGVLIRCVHGVLQADKENFEQWEQKMARERSRGQFFQSLYQTDKKRPVGSDSADLQVSSSRLTMVSTSVHWQGHLLSSRHGVTSLFWLLDAAGFAGRNRSRPEGGSQQPTSDVHILFSGDFAGRGCRRRPYKQFRVIGARCFLWCACGSTRCKFLVRKKGSQPVAR
jgi:hypothetical protein